MWISVVITCFSLKGQSLDKLSGLCHSRSTPVYFPLMWKTLPLHEMDAMTRENKLPMFMESGYSIRLVDPTHRALSLAPGLLGPISLPSRLSEDIWHFHHTWSPMVQIRARAYLVAPPSSWGRPQVLAQSWVTLDWQTRMLWGRVLVEQRCGEQTERDRNREFHDSAAWRRQVLGRRYSEPGGSIRRSPATAIKEKEKANRLSRIRGDVTYVKPSCVFSSKRPVRKSLKPLQVQGLWANARAVFENPTSFWRVEHRVTQPWQRWTCGSFAKGGHHV